MQQILSTVLIDDPRTIAWHTLSDADWTMLTTVAQAEGVVPLVCQAFDAFEWPTHLPVAVRHGLLLERYHTTAQTLLIHGELRRLLGVLAPALPVVVLKGAALGPTVYGNPALRSLSDIDLLVPHAQLDVATALLSTLGYHVDKMSSMAPGAEHRITYHRQLRGGPGNHVVIELHWNLIANEADWRAPDVTWFWQHTCAWFPCNDAQQWGDIPPVLQFTPTVQVLYLAAHLALQHGGAGARLIWLYDLHLLLTQKDAHIDWTLLIEQARRLRWAAGIAAALDAVQRVFSTPIPNGICAVLDAAAARDDRQFVQQKITGASVTVTLEWLNVLALPARARMHFLLDVCFPRPAYIRWRYALDAARLWPLGYMRHWRYLAHKSVRLMQERVRASVLRRGTQQ